ALRRYQPFQNEESRITDEHGSPRRPQRGRRVLSIEPGPHVGGILLWPRAATSSFIVRMEGARTSDAQPVMDCRFNFTNQVFGLKWFRDMRPKSGSQYSFAILLAGITGDSNRRNVFASVRHSDNVFD